MSYILAVLISLFAGWSLAAVEALFRNENRPGIFHGSTGTALLLLLTAVGAVFATGGFLWILRSIASATVLVIIVGGGWLGFTASNRLHVNAAGAINRLMVGLAGLLVFYGLTWSFFPPPD